MMSTKRLVATIKKKKNFKNPIEPTDETFYIQISETRVTGYVKIIACKIVLLVGDWQHFRIELYKNKRISATESI